MEVEENDRASRAPSSHEASARPWVVAVGRVMAPAALVVGGCLVLLYIYTWATLGLHKVEGFGPRLRGFIRIAFHDGPATALVFLVAVGLIVYGTVAILRICLEEAGWLQRGGRSQNG